jgi:hypothetical protein
MKYNEMQKIAKQVGIKANMKVMSMVMSPFFLVCLSPCRCRWQHSIDIWHCLNCLK